jgi:zinc protease
MHRDIFRILLKPELRTLQINRLIPPRTLLHLAALIVFLIAAPLVRTVHAKEPDGLGGPDISHFFLDNGLEVVVIPDHRAPIVTHMVWYKVGSADEVAGKSGLAHFFEHLMFKGTKENPQGTLGGAVAQIGGQDNAFTSYDYTAFYEKISPSALKTMMALEADRMRNLVLNDNVVNTERDVVLEERGSRIDNNPGSLLSEETAATLFQNSPYGRPIIGWRREMKQLNLADAVAFYNAHYEPNNAILVVAGDVTADQVRKLAGETYGKVPRGPDLPPRDRPQEPHQDTSRTVTLKDARVTAPRFSKYFLVPSYNTAKLGEAEALDLLAEILGGDIRSRLYQDLAVKKQIAASVGTWYQGTALDPTIFAIEGQPLPGTPIEKLEQAVLDEVADIVKNGVTAEEVEKAKNRFLKSAIFARDDQFGMAQLFGSSLATGLTVKDVQEWPDRIRAVTAKQIQDVAGRYLDNDHSVTSYLLPKTEGRS